MNLFMVIALGLKGNEWAWKHRKWESIEHFKKVQREWAKASFIVVTVLFLFAFIMVFSIESIFKDSEPYKESFRKVIESPEVSSLLGSPIESGLISGSMQTSGPEGLANLAYSVEGPKGGASVAVRAYMELNSWVIECLVVNYEGTDQQTTIIPCK